MVSIWDFESARVDGVQLLADPLSSDRWKDRTEVLERQAVWNWLDSVSSSIAVEDTWVGVVEVHVGEGLLDTSVGVP